jgi:hypothetical protein
MMQRHAKSRKAAMREGYVSMELTPTQVNNEEPNDRRQVMEKDADVQRELIAIILDELEWNDRRQVMGKDVAIQTEKTATTLDDELTNGRRAVMSENIEIESDALHNVDELQLDLNAEETLDNRQVIIAVENFDNALDDDMTKNSRVVDATAEESNLTTTNISNDIRADLRPVVGYADEILLPLFKACAPLTNIVHNLSFYIQMALSETPEQPSDGLTIDESAAIRLYTIEWDKPHRSLYSMLNHTLMKDDREQLGPYFKYLKLLLTALVKLPCVPQLTVWRGVTKNVSVKFPPGTSVTWWGFSSCTVSLTVLENNMYLGNTGNRTLFSVEAINGRAIRSHSHFATEDELLLLPGTHMIVQSQLSPAPDLHIIHLKQVIPQEMLLEPPFEGIIKISNHLFEINSISMFRRTSLSKNSVSLT